MKNTQNEPSYLDFYSDLEIKEYPYLSSYKVYNDIDSVIINTFDSRFRTHPNNQFKTTIKVGDVIKVRKIVWSCFEENPSSNNDFEEGVVVCICNADGYKVFYNQFICIAFGKDVSYLPNVSPTNNNYVVVPVGFEEGCFVLSKEPEQQKKHTESKIDTESFWNDLADYHRGKRSLSSLKLPTSKNYPK